MQSNSGEFMCFISGDNHLGKQARKLFAKNCSGYVGIPKAFILQFNQLFRPENGGFTRTQK